MDKVHVLNKEDLCKLLGIQSDKDKVELDFNEESEELAVTEKDQEVQALWPQRPKAAQRKKKKKLKPEETLKQIKKLHTKAKKRGREELNMKEFGKVFKECNGKIKDIADKLKIPYQTAYSRATKYKALGGQ